MVIKLIRLIFGYVSFKLRSDNPERFLTLASRNGIILWDIRRTENGLSAKTSVKSYFSLHRSARKSNSLMKVTHKFGIPFIVKRYSGRFGLIAGPVLALLIIYCCSLFVWSVDIEQLPGIPPEELRSAVYNAGLKPGILISSISAPKTDSAIMLNDSRLSWAGIAAGSSRIKVNLAAADKIPDFLDSDSVTNLVALKDGVIVSLDIREGKKEVQTGDVVAQGDLLASGIVDSETGYSRGIHAYGNVYAKTQEEFSVTEPLTVTGYKTTGNSRSFYRLCLFGFELKLMPENTDFNSYQSIIDISPLRILGVEFPFSLKKITCFETEAVTETRTAEETAGIAGQYASAMANSLLYEGEILEIEETTSFNDDSVTVTLIVTRIENIAFEEEVEIESQKYEAVEDKE